MPASLGDLLMEPEAILQFLLDSFYLPQSAGVKEKTMFQHQPRLVLPAYQPTTGQPQYLGCPAMAPLSSTAYPPCRISLNPQFLPRLEDDMKRDLGVLRKVGV